MNDSDINAIKTVIREEVTSVVKKELKPINEKLGKVDLRLGRVEEKVGNVELKLGKVEQKVNTIWDQTAKLTEDMEEVKETLSSHTSFLKRIEGKVEHNAENIEKVGKRLVTVESLSGIVPPSELVLTR